ncbi:MAG TPA: hypothetical protein DIW31_03320, partial [Bacteroidales bacterium]|nr:hypothetical protein [Bacteroidales bacterium]
NGQYDIVYLGNNTSGGSYTALGTAPTNLPQGGSNNGSGTSKEYYCDNDITNRRANILKDFINSKQLTIFENSILSNNSSIQSTKLYTNFISYKSNSTYPNFTIVDTSSSKTTNLINAFSVYNTGTLAKKPKLKINNPAHDQPVIYDGTDASYQTNKSLGFKFDINNLSTANNMAAKLYIDNNGDGIFKASDDYAGKSELVYKMDDLNSGAGYTINYRLPDSYIGLQPWKLELTDNSTGAKSYITGATAFKGNSGDEVNLRLLQLEPDGNTFSIYSLSNVNGQNLLYKDKVYRIQVTEMNISDFNAAYTHTTPTAASAKVNGVTTTAPTVLNGNYDMLIMGFADVYGNGDLTNTNAINALKNFIATNQSVMLTHDTLTFQANSPNTWGYNITQNFRNLVGQQRYYHSAPDANRYYNPMPNSGKDSYGFTNLTLGRYNNGVTNNGKTFETTTSTHKINDNLVTQFPFPLGDITVSGTHFQYYQLDLEDQNVVPVYSLTNSGSSSIYNHPGDGRNDYYTYTKGNITFSGTGHSKVNDDNSIDEEKMFLNTIIKASRGANHAPTLDVNGISDGMNIANASQSINFSFTATDIDPGDQYLNANVNLSISTDGTAFSPYTTIHQFDDQDPDLTQRVKSGVPHATSVSIANSTNITAYKVQVVVTDNQGAIVSKETIINSVNDPQVTPQSPNNLSCLVGDTLSIPVTVVATPTGLNETFKNINLRGIKTNPSGVATQVMSSVATDYPDITFDPAPSSSNQLKAYPVTNNYSVPFNDVGTNEILTQLNYTAYMGTSQTGITRKNEQTFSVQVKSGEIDVHVVALENGIPKGITGIPMVINGPFKDETTNTTDSSGSASYTGLGSGNYTVTLTVPEGYSFDNSANQPVDVNLSANNPEQPITFTLKQQSLLAPTGLEASDITQTSATLTWDTTLGATSYNVYKDGIFYASSETNTAPITGLTANTTYTFTVSAIHAGGESPKSSPASVTTLNEMLISNPKITTRTGANAVSILKKVPIQGTV